MFLIYRCLEPAQSIFSKWLHFYSNFVTVNDKKKYNELWKSLHEKVVTNKTNYSIVFDLPGPRGLVSNVEIPEKKSSKHIISDRLILRYHKYSLSYLFY